MNKQEIISILDDFQYSRDEYWIITGSAMVLYGIREQTHDIDMGCTSKMADQLAADGYSFSLTESGNRKFEIGENIEIFENWIKDTIGMVDNVPVISIKGLILMKQELGRDKDKKDIALIKEYIGKKIELVENVLKPEDFVRLRATTGFADIPVEHARKALSNGLINISVLKDGELIGMGRLVGDGAMYWYLQEIVVLPEYQGMGIGTKIVNYLVDYAVKNSSTGKFTTIGGVSAKGKEGFYQKLGFEVISNGIRKMIEI
jgi:GNAT superfamily N-acetyltransferase